MKKILLTSLLSFTVFYGISQITNGLIAHFPFNSNLTDISPSSISATDNGCTYVTDRNGVANNAIGFNNNSNVTFTDVDLKVQFPLTVSFWAKLNTQDVYILFKTDNVFENYYGVAMNSLPSGGLTISFGGGLGGANTSNQRYYTTDITTFTAGTWHHVVGIIRDYNDMDIYIDCVKANGTYGGTGSTSVAYSSSGDSRIGGSIGTNVHPGDFYLDGSMDQFAFWNRELTSQEVDTLCQQEVTLSNNEIAVKEFDLNVSPNPSSDVAHVSFGTAVNAKIEVYNVLGDKMMTTKCSNKNSVSLNVDNWSKGVYILKIDIDGMVQTKRFIKE